MSKKVLIFSKKVLPRSNTFIATQGNNLPTYQPVYVGLRHDTSGVELLQGKDTCVQEDYHAVASLSRYMLDGAGIVGTRWAGQLKAVGASVMHANFGKGGYYSVPIARKLRLPLITTFHGSDITQKDRFSYGKRHRQMVFKHSSKILAVSKFIESRLRQAGCPANKIVQHYIGLNTGLFKPGGEKTANPTILFVGRLIEQKGCQYLLQAMRQVQKQCPDAELVIAGSGVYKDALQKAAGELDNITFTGAQSSDQVRELMASAWVTCLPSIRMARGNEEGMPTVCIESQAVGTPVVAFDTGGVREGVVHEKTGLLSMEKDVTAMANDLLTVLQDPGLRSKMASAGVKRVNEKFNVQRQCEKLESIYDSVCQ